VEGVHGIYTCPPGRTPGGCGTAFPAGMISLKGTMSLAGMIWQAVPGVEVRHKLVVHLGFINSDP
jgi:hypothetical protein